MKQGRGHLTIKRVIHQGAHRLAIEFDYDREMVRKVKMIPGARWSSTKRYWHVPPDTDMESYVEALSAIEGEINERTRWKEEKKKAQKKKPILLTTNQEAISELMAWMKQYSYSESTIELYTRSIRKFFIWVNKPWKDLTSEDIIAFNKREFVTDNGWHRYTAHNIFVSAMKLFFKARRSTNLVPDDIVRPRRRKKLPTVLSEEEVRRLIRCTNNIKHRVLLMLIYSAGLRIGETLNLKLTDIDSDRRVIDIHFGKGKKDRRVPLSNKVLVALREYYQIYRPKVYLFEGEVEGKAYSPKSSQNVLRRAVRRSGIKKRVTLHTLRHSYATHLMERGVGLRYIQEILGHASPKTTMIYTHVSGKRLRDIVSPVDEMDI